MRNYDVLVISITTKKTPAKGKSTCARDSLLFIRDVDVGPKLDLFERSFPPPGDTGQNEQSKRRFASAQQKPLLIKLTFLMMSFHSPTAPSAPFSHSLPESTQTRSLTMQKPHATDRYVGAN